MDKPIDHYWSLHLESTRKALAANGFDVYVAEDEAQATRLVLELILPATGAMSVSWGGSQTFKDCGLLDIFRTQRSITVEGIELIDTFEKGLPADEKHERRRRALLADLFFTGANAITRQGQLVNLDMIGNRVAALTFGPHHVVVLAGRNKIVADVDAARARIKEYAAPVNAIRLNKKTPCAKTGRCEDCNSTDRICNTWTITEKSFPIGRIKVILINRDLGF